MLGVRNGRARGMWIGWALACSVLATGCATHVDSSCVKVKVLKQRVSPDSKSFDRYLAFLGGDPDEPGFAFIRSPLQLWGPFFYQFTAGLFDEEAVANAGEAIVCSELDELPASEGDPLRFIVLCAARLAGGGFQVFASENVTTGSVQNVPGQVVIAADQVQMAVELTGLGAMNFYARAAGSETWQVVNSAPFPYDQVRALLPSFGVSNTTAKKSEYGVDDVEIVQNTAPPGPLGEDEAVALALMAGLEDLFRAIFALDAGSNDLESARDRLDDAAVDLEDALDQLAGLEETRERKKAAKQLAGALKAVDKAGQKIDQAIEKGSQKAKPLINKIQGALKKADKALVAILPYAVDF